MPMLESPPALAPSDERVKLYDEKKDTPLSVNSEVIRWTSRINAAKRKFEPDFDRMKADEEFIYGIQWPGQEDLNDERFSANIVMREVNQAVAALYARNPKAVVRIKDRIDHTFWDGTPESLVRAAQTVSGGMFDPISMLVIEDFMRVTMEREQLRRLGETLEKWYKVQIDKQEPDFKLQMKQLVRRVKVCGCGYVRLAYKQDARNILAPSQTIVPIQDRMKKIMLLVEQHSKGQFDETSSQLDELKKLLGSVQYAQSDPSQQRESAERLVIDFPSATSIIVDPKCRMLKGFVGAQWIVQEYILPLNEVRAFFEKTDLKVGAGGAKNYTMQGESAMQMELFKAEGQMDESHVCVWELFNKVDRTRSFLCDGYKDYLQEPEESRPCIQRFWPILPITFNDTETEMGAKATIYPPSDVRLMRSAQLEWNNCEQRLREHRRSNRPKYMTGKGWLTQEDKLILQGNTKVGSVIELAGAPPDADVGKLLQPFKHSPIDPGLYVTDNLQRAILLTTGSQQANLGPITNRGTATEASISEQSKISSVSSNVDDLDELLTEMARVAGEMGLREASVQSVKRDVGQGAVWPEGNREEYVSRIYLEIQASSSGRPNQAMEIAFMREVIPLLVQAGANPIFIIEEIVKRWDDRLDINRAFPVIPPPNPAMAGMAPQAGGAQGPPANAAKQVPNRTTAGPPAPIPASTDAASPNNAMT